MAACLIAGGKTGSVQLKTLEIFDPATRTFALTAPLKYARQDHTATLLTDGTVLIAGGASASGPLSSAEIYNPVTGKVTQTGSLNQARTLATASTLYNFDSTVLIEGGQGAGGADLNTAEEYDPATGTFTTLTAHMNTARSGHVGVTLPYNGKVLIAGGTSAGQPVAANEIYDPVTGTFVANEPMSRRARRVRGQFLHPPRGRRGAAERRTGRVGQSADADRDVFAIRPSAPTRADYPPGSPVTIYWNRICAGRDR